MLFLHAIEYDRDVSCNSLNTIFHLHYRNVTKGRDFHNKRIHHSRSRSHPYMVNLIVSHHSMTITKPGLNLKLNWKNCYPIPTKTPNSTFLSHHNSLSYWLTFSFGISFSRAFGCWSTFDWWDLGLLTPKQEQFLI